MQPRSIAEITDIAKRCLGDKALPAYVRDLASITLQIAQDIEQSATTHPATFKTLYDIAECLIEEAAAYTVQGRGPE